jgi:hypothetical protein
LNGIEIDIHYDLMLLAGATDSVGCAWSPNGGVSANGSFWFGFWLDDGSEDLSVGWHPLIGDIEDNNLRVFATGLGAGNPVDSAGIEGEVIGFRFWPQSEIVDFRNIGTPMLGPVFDLDSGQHVVEFAAKRDTAFAVWLASEIPGLDTLGAPPLGTTEWLGDQEE